MKILEHHNLYLNWPVYFANCSSIWTTFFSSRNSVPVSNFAGELVVSSSIEHSKLKKTIIFQNHDLDMGTWNCRWREPHLMWGWIRPRGKNVSRSTLPHDVWDRKIVDWRESTRLGILCRLISTTKIEERNRLSRLVCKSCRIWKSSKLVCINNLK